MQRNEHRRDWEHTVEKTRHELGRVAAACRLTGLGKTRLYELLTESRDRILTCSLRNPGAEKGARLIHLPSLLGYLEHLAIEQRADVVKIKESTSSNDEPTAGTRGFVQGILDRTNQENMERSSGNQRESGMIGATPYQRDNLVRWSFLDQNTKQLQLGSNLYADFIAKVKGRSATTVKVQLLAWRAYGAQNYHTIAKLTNRPLPMIELFTSGEVIADEICRGKLVELTARITADPMERLGRNPKLKTSRL
jgi:hypothetical protein